MLTCGNVLLFSGIVLKTVISLRLFWFYASSLCKGSFDLIKILNRNFMSNLETLTFSIGDEQNLTKYVMKVINQLRRITSRKTILISLAKIVILSITK